MTLNDLEWRTTAASPTIMSDPFATPKKGLYIFDVRARNPDMFHLIDLGSSGTKPSMKPLHILQLVALLAELDDGGSGRV